MYLFDERDAPISFRYHFLAKLHGLSANQAELKEDIERFRHLVMDRGGNADQNETGKITVPDSWVDCIQNTFNGKRGNA